MYLLTGPVMEAVHSEPYHISLETGCGTVFHAPGRSEACFPVDGSHVCAICALLTARLTTPVLPYQLSALHTVSLVAVPATSGRPVLIRYFTPDKRGPPPSHV